MKMNDLSICFLALGGIFISGTSVSAQSSASAAEAAELNRAESEYRQYESKANSYQMEATKKLEALQQNEALEKNKITELERQSKTAPKILRGKIMSQIESCRKAEINDEAQVRKVETNLNTTNSWLHYLQNKVSTAQHNISETEQLALEASQKARDRQAQVSWESSLNSLNQNNYGYDNSASSPRGYGRSYRQGNFNSYHYSPPGSAGNNSPSERAASAGQAGNVSSSSGHVGHFSHSHR